MSAEQQQSGRSWWDEEQELLRKMREAGAERALAPDAEVPVHDLSGEVGAYEAMPDTEIRRLIARAEDGLRKYEALHQRLDAELRRRRGDDAPVSELPDDDEDGPIEFDRAA